MIYIDFSTDYEYTQQNVLLRRLLSGTEILILCHGGLYPQLGLIPFQYSMVDLTRQPYQLAALLPYRLYDTIALASSSRGSLMSVLDIGSGP